MEHVKCKKDITGIIFNIQKFCVNDGPGIRTTIFLKGCPLRCKWCHNPEGLSFSDNEIDTSNMDMKIRALVNRPIEQSEIIDIVKEDLEFYEATNGGITLSGGEPLAQLEFSREILKACKENNINTCVETSGYCKPEGIMEIAKYTDLFLYDIKDCDEDKHIENTKVSNKIILENLEVLSIMNKEVILRVPIIPGVNDREEHFNFINNIKLKYSNIIEVQIMPYHNLGMSKSEKYGIESTEYKEPSREMVNKWRAKIKGQ